MNQPHSKTIRYAAARVCVLLVLLLLGWFVLREPPVPANDQPIETATAPPRVRHVAPRFASEDAADRETMTNQVAESPTTNAATIYRQAFALLDLLTDEQKELVRDWRTNVNAEVEAELCEKIRPICDLMHQASAMTNCDWGLKQPITIDTLFPHLLYCRSLARVAMWSVAHCRADDPTGAVDDLVASSRVGENLSPALIGHLVNLAIQGLVIDSVTEQVSTLASAGDTRLLRLFQDLSYDESFSRAFEQEADGVSRTADKWAGMSPDEFTELVESIQSDDKPAFQSMQPSEFIAGVRLAADLIREFAKALELPDAEYRELLSRVQTAGSMNPVAGFFLGTYDAVVDKTQAMTVKSAMIATGLAFMQQGPDALQSHLDPATDQPFGYTQTDNGFELESSYQFKGDRIKLRFK